MDFLKPPRLLTAQGEIRRVGFEIEFGGLPLEEAARLVQNLFGGELISKNIYSYSVHGSQIGDFTIESDSRLLSEKKYEQYLERWGLKPDSSLRGNIEKIFERLSGTLLPFEVAMPPLPISHLQPAEELRKALHEHSAQGISSSVFAAFGMQMNPEVPDFSVRTLLSYLRAFLLLSDWLTEETVLPWARKVTPFVHPFPLEYQDLVLDFSYKPSLTKLMMDYLHFNPTRNRSLDFLPLFAFLDASLVLRYPVERDLVRARPTFHYRLPNSEIDDPNWSFALEWNKWIEVERLAADSEKLNAIQKDFHDSYDPNFLFSKSQWIERTREWIHETS